ncbi:substrate-binding domain-containing protein [Cupriavidus basilensis]
MSVRKGAPKPDISSTEAVKRTLLEARSIAYSASASGILSFQRVVSPAWRRGPRIKDQGTTRSDSERVGTVVARGDAEIGFQQVSELLPFKELDYVGPLPDELQQRVFFSAGTIAGRQTAATSRFVSFLASPAAAAIVSSTGLEPVATPLPPPAPPMLGRPPKP